MKHIHNHSGFTLLEILLSVSVLAIIGTISIGMYFSYQSSNDLNLTSSTLAQMLRRAQTLARAGAHGSDWGVSVEDSRLILFSGSDFESRDQALDEIYPIPVTLEIVDAPTISGSCEDGNTVRVTITDTHEVIETKCRNNSFSAQPLQEFSLSGNGATATQTDLAGNVSQIQEISW